MWAYTFAFGAVPTKDTAGRQPYRETPVAVKAELLEVSGRAIFAAVLYQHCGE